MLSGNGSEFRENFETKLKSRHIIHCWPCPKSSKMNAHCERFNRTLQESFVDFHEDLLFGDIGEFNRALTDWRVFYNTQCPHQALELKSPMQFLLDKYPECHILWARTAGLLG